MSRDRLIRIALPVLGLALLIAGLAFLCRGLRRAGRGAAAAGPGARLRRSPTGGWCVCRRLDHAARKPLRLRARLRARRAARGRDFELAHAQPDVLSAADRDPVAAQGRACAADPGVARHRHRIQARHRLAGGVLSDRGRHRDRACATRRPNSSISPRRCAPARFQTFWKIRFPAALPFVISGSKVAITLAVIGAVIGEFIGSNEGLGNLLLVANSQLNIPLAFACLFGLADHRHRALRRGGAGRAGAQAVVRRDRARLTAPTGCCRPTARSAWRCRVRSRCSGCSRGRSISQL